MQLYADIANDEMYITAWADQRLLQGNNMEYILYCPGGRPISIAI